jgi:hypothetical protein
LGRAERAGVVCKETTYETYLSGKPATVGTLSTVEVGNLGEEEEKKVERDGRRVLGMTVDRRTSY